MKKNLTVITMLIALCLFVGKADAAFIVNTGTPTGGGSYLTSSYWLAGEFDLSSAHTITDIEGYINNWEEGGETATAAIYLDDHASGDIPGSELFSQQFSVPFSYGWSGPSGLSWDLDPGTYWIAFEVRTGDSLVADMWGNTPSPLGNEASWSSGSWSESDAINLGFRIQGDPIPIPGAVWLLGSCLIGIVGIRRKFKG